VDTSTSLNYVMNNRLQVDFDKVVMHIGSKSVASVRERLRLCRKKVIHIEGEAISTSSPAGGVDKKSVGKVNGSPRKAGAKSKGKASKKGAVKEEKDEGKDSEHTDSKGNQMVEGDDGV
jgi:hypothetical protein